MARDRFQIKVKCPSCGKSGVAHAEEADGFAYVRGDRTTAITFLPEGFRIVQRQSMAASVDIECIEHAGTAVVWPSSLEA